MPTAATAPPVSTKKSVTLPAVDVQHAPVAVNESPPTGPATSALVDSMIRRLGRITLRDDSVAEEFLRRSRAAAATIDAQTIFVRPDRRNRQEVIQHELVHVAQLRSGNKGSRTDSERFADKRNLSEPGPAAVPPLFQKDEPAQQSLQPDPSAPSNKPAHFVTYALFRLIAHERISDLEHELKGIDAGAPARVRAEAWIADVKAWEPTLIAKGSAELDESALQKIDKWNAELVGVSQDVEAYKDSDVRQKLRRAKKSADRAAVESNAMIPDLRANLRPAYMKDDESKLAQIGEMLGTVLDVGLSLKELSSQIAEALGEEIHDIPPRNVRGILMSFKVQKARGVGHATELLVKLNRVLAAVNVFWSITHTEAPTEAGEASKKIKVMSDMAAAGATIFDLSPHFALYCDLYLVPLTQAVVARVSALVDTHLHELNVVAAATDFRVRFENEPGGVAVGEFMVQVMKAEDLSETPAAIPSEVAKYFGKNREKISKGARDELPTKRRLLLFRRIDTTKARDWVFFHRDALWGMFYGAMQVPESVE